MIHAVLHDAKDTVAVAVVEGITSGTTLNAWIMDEDQTISLKATQDIPIGHKVALRDMSVGDTVYKYGIDIVHEPRVTSGPRDKTMSTAAPAA